MSVFNSLTVLAVHASLVRELLNTHCEYADQLEVGEYQAVNGTTRLVDFTLNDSPYSPFGVELTLLSLQIPYTRYNDRLDGEIDAETHQGYFNDRGHYACTTAYVEDESIELATLKQALENGADALVSVVQDRLQQQPKPVDWARQESVFITRTHPYQGEGDAIFTPLIACLDDEEQQIVDRYVNKIIQLEGILPEQVCVNARTLNRDQYLSATPPAMRKTWQQAVSDVIAASPALNASPNNKESQR